MKKEILRIKYLKLRKADGYFNSHNNTIEIDAGLNQMDTISTLYHEFTHYIVYKALNEYSPEKVENVKGILIRKKRFEKEEEKVCEKIEKYCTKEIESFFQKIS